MTTKKAKRKKMRAWLGWCRFSAHSQWHSRVYRSRQELAEASGFISDLTARVRVTEVRTPTRKAKSTQHKAAKAAGGAG